MANVNITEVRLLNVPLTNDYIHTLHFESAAAQSSYFLSKTVSEKRYTDFSYQRKDNIIRIPDHYDSLLNCNYVMYKNAAYSSKWFYAFITDLTYIDDGRTDIKIETDVIQTWLFEYSFQTSFIEREHVRDDTVGKHTVHEGLETGDYVISSKNKNASLCVTSLIIGTTVDLNDFNNALFKADKYAPAGGEVYNGIFSGIKYFEVTRSELKRIIKDLAKHGQSDAIVSIFTCPSLFVSSHYPEDKVYSPENPVGYAAVDFTESAGKKTWRNTFGVDDTDILKPKKVDGYTPDNNKLLTYPFNYMLMSNNSGSSAVYKYELFNNPDNERLCDFYIYSAITPSFSITMSPRYYNNVDINSLERLNLGKFPICAWSTDVYTNWLTQNGVNMSVSLGGALAGAAVGAAGAALAPATGGTSALVGIGIAGSVLGAGASIAGNLSERYQHSLQPPQAEGNVNSGDVAFSSGILTFTAYQMSVKAEMAKIIDNFFNMYGYKTNRVGLPETRHRQEYWYTKTIDANIFGAIPMSDLQKIKACYNKGITFWRNPANIGNYTVSNTTL